MLISNNHSDKFKNLKSNSKTIQNQSAFAAEQPIMPDLEMAERLRVAFSGLKAEIEGRMIRNIIKNEFGKDIPSLAVKVKQKLSDSDRQKTLGIG